MPDNQTTVWKKTEIPYNWNPERAVPFFDLAAMIDKHLRKGIAMSREVLLVIFFHETGFANVRQSLGTGPAVGFGQMEIFNTDKIPFFESIKYNSVTHNPKVPVYLKKSKYSYLNHLEALTYETVLKDNNFAVQMHCQYFSWLNDEGVPSGAVEGQKGIKSLKGMLEAQVGGGRNRVFVDHFVESGTALKEVIDSGNRQKIIDALNSVRYYYDKEGKLVQQSLILSRWTRYWDLILPANAPQLF
ncbi:MAG: hypothetical protein FJ267_10965, partial [Planctomycetes bacterium]|nr:hypothetical protein [Planctomycetota bacterium]